jgi:predicted metal-dependent phosphoesterase TrpH
MKCDMHVHTLHSGMCTQPVAKKFCRESYSDPDAVYEKLKSLGMDLVTITDHDSIGAADRLRRHPDFFSSEEITCQMPSGTKVHIGVYDLTERQHIELQRRRDDFFSLMAYMGEQRLLCSVNHFFSGLTGRRDRFDYVWFEQMFPCLETRNGALLEMGNQRAAEFARMAGKAVVAGSDAHTLWSVGSAYTSVPEARTKDEFLSGLRAGHGIALGSSGSYWKLTRDVLGICCGLMKERPWALALSPLMAAVPAAILVNYGWEVLFANYWFRKAMGVGRAEALAPLRPRRVVA